ncbi:MAG TPA: heavy metal translocating P-type ATPase, partial [Actinomycetales bacterium]|nr:heavy metal translocating P-type ATPase [Actinomycetales bacterium]
MQIEGMTCASCVGHVERRLNKMPGVTAVVNLATERAKLTLTEDHTNQELEGAVTAAGYAGTVTRRRSSHDDDAHPAATTSPHRSVLSENDAVLPGGAGDHARAGGDAGDHSHASGEDAGHAQGGGEHADHDPLSGHSHAGHGGGAVADTSDPSARRQADLKRRFLVAAVLTVPVMVLSMAPPLQFPGWQWLVTALTLPVVVWAGLPFHKAAFNAARHGSSTMDTLVSLGTISATAWSLWALLFGGAGEIGMRMEMSLWPRAASEHGAHPELYFEVAAVVITFLLLGRWLESRSRRAAGDALRALAQMQPAEATKIVRAGSITREVRVPLAEIRVGDEFRVEPGEKIATDGTVTGGRSAVDASLLTGESVPVEVGPGDSVTGATLNTSGSLIVRATRVGEDTTLAQIGHLVEEAQVGKAPVQRIADQISAVFVPVVLVIAVITFVLWMVLGGTTQQAFTAAIAVLIIACP